MSMAGKKSGVVLQFGVMASDISMESASGCKTVPLNRAQIEDPAAAGSSICAHCPVRFGHGTEPVDRVLNDGLAGPHDRFC
jgi:hypothetical protein